ncbi:MAG: serine/threonine-protein kinase [Cyanobacteria bacterium P01_G01_bin.4]
MIGQLLGGRYKISSILATGGMSQTYLARDAQRPGQPTCVVKRLQPPSIEPDQLQLARRLFNTEADVLHQLGTHEQIPQLLAYFEEAGEFYLIQEYIDGILLFDNLKTGQRWSESDVIQFLEDVLNLLCFVHERGAIHRDIKPGNLIQRPDSKWVLLDFGAVKQVHLTQLQAGQDMSITVAIGTPGYLAPESICGKPRFSSDIFSLGVVAICALTGLSPDAIQDPNSEDWRERCPDISARLKTILERMTQLNFALRYTTAQQVLTDLTTSDLAGIGTSTASIPATILASATIPPTVYMRRYVTQTFKHLAPLAQTIPAIQNLRKTRQLVGVGLCVGLSLGGLHQLARASQTRARAQLDTLTAAAQAADHSTCIETAQAISPFSPIHSDARDILGNCQLAHARQQAQSGHMRDAIATAHQVSRGAPAYDAAQVDIQSWSDRILELAAARYRQGEFDTAIAMADAIPNYSPTRSTARRTIGDWRREWQRDERLYQQAQQAFERGEWNNAIAATEEISSPYWQTQATSIVQQSNARLQPAPRPAPAQPAPIPEPAPVAVSAPPPAPQPQAAATPTTPQSVENQQQGWIQIQRNIERVQRQQVRVQQERVRRGRDDDDWEDDDWDDDDDDNRQSVRAQSNRRNRNRNSQNRNVTLEDRVVNELETQIRRGVEGLLN